MITTKYELYPPNPFSNFNTCYNVILKFYLRLRKCFPSKTFLNQKLKNGYVPVMKTFALKKVPAAWNYLHYRLVANTAHQIHSPFVFDLYNNVIKDATPYYAFRVIESIRAKMLLSGEKIVVHDFGTGRSANPEEKRSLQFIASHYVKPIKYAQLLFRLVNEFLPIYILELGTSLGITTMYLASPLSSAKVITLEGCPNTAAVAKKNFRDAQVKNIEQIIGEFSVSLPEALSKMPRLDFVYFDGNHKKDATLDYFFRCLPKHHEQTVFVFDDIHWNLEMTEAWKIIQQHEATTLTIDLFSIGIVFFRKGIPKQHFVLKF